MAASSSNMFGQIGSMFNMSEDGFDPFAKVAFPGADQFWAGKATKASSLTNPVSSLTWNDPGQYQQMQDWSTWKSPTENSKYQGQYEDNGYSSQQAKSMYQQPSDGDWSKYQKDLQQPGEAAAKTAYDQAMASIKGSAAATGMYGSSVMNSQANDKAGRNYADALTSNASQAAVNTQNAQESSNQYMADLEKSLLGARMSEWGSLGSREQQTGLAENQFNQNQDSQQSAELQNLNSYDLNRSKSQNDWDMTKAQDEGKWNWSTMQYDNALEKSWWDDYIMKQASWDQSERSNLFNNYLTWWGMGNPTAEENMQNDTASKAASREEDSGWGDVLSGGLGLLGKIGGYGTGGGSTVFSSMFGLGA